MAKKKEAITPEQRLQEALVPESEWPYQLPENWCWVKGTTIFEKMESTHPAGKYFRYIDIDAIDNKNQRVTEPKILPVDKAPSRASRRIHAGDTIFSLVRPYLKNIAFIDETLCDAIASTGFYICTPNKCVSSPYVYYLMISPHVVDGLNKYMKGDNSPSIRKDDIELFAYPLPPLPEQQRIVERIESLFAQLDEAKEKAQAALDSFEPRKAAILHKAFTGELTAKWREEHGHSKSDYIATSRKLRDEQAQKTKSKKLKYEFPDDLQLYTIPTSWQFVQIGDIAWSIKDGPHYSPKYVKEGIPFITGGNVRPDGVDFASAKRISQELHAELCKRCKPELGDMLYTKGGTTGIARVNTYDFEFSVWVHVAVIKFVDTVLPEYFQHVLNSPYCYEQSQKYTHGVGNQDLGLTRMVNIVFPICSIDEQEEIVRILDSLLTKEQQAKEAAEAVLEQIDLTKKAILARAFRGELGTNDPAEENSEELLKEILTKEV